MTRVKFLYATFVVVLAVSAALRAQAGLRGDVLDANTASEKELLALPGMTPALAKTVTDRRPFLAMTDLNTLVAASLNAEQRTALYRRLFVQINLNTASDAEIQLIPGLGPRMLHEFKEYRPYKAMAQFRREIGKYVDEKEVARLERYVTIN